MEVRGGCAAPTHMEDKRRPEGARVCDLLDVGLDLLEWVFLELSNEWCWACVSETYRGISTTYREFFFSNLNSIDTP